MKNGFILLVVLIFLSLIASLSLFSMQRVANHMRSYRGYFDSVKAREIARFGQHHEV